MVTPLVDSNTIKLIECPRDAMQGIQAFIPTAEKIDYLNTLLQIGFDTLDFGSFVSAKAIPQMQDTAQLIDKLSLANTCTKLLAIVANLRGAQEAVQFQEIHYLGFPFSVSEIFQIRNTNATIEESFATVCRIQELCLRFDKTLVVYLSMGFGNPYGEKYSPELVARWVERLSGVGIKILSFSDTVGVAEPASIKALYTHITPHFKEVEFGVHLHSHPHTRTEKLQAAFESGCSRFDGALLGFGGCPMAKDDLVGNMATEVMVDFFTQKGVNLALNEAFLVEAQAKANRLFSTYH
jgi:hydroxymethylglutaryl-CoA lyase